MMKVIGVITKPSGLRNTQSAGQAGRRPGVSVCNWVSGGNGVKRASQVTVNIPHSSARLSSARLSVVKLEPQLWDE